MTRLPSLPVREVARKLRRAGFVFDRRAKGSHEIWMHPRTRRRVTIPNHPGDMPKGTLNAVLEQAGIGLKEFLEL